MARDPGEGGAFVFDLVDDDGADPGLPGPGGGAGGDGTDGGEPGGGGPEGDEPDGAGSEPVAAPWGGVLGPGLRRLAPVAAVLAVLLGTGFAVDGLRDAARIERIRTVPGGVADVSAPLRAVWTWDGEVGPAGLAEAFAVADLGGVLAFRTEGALVGLDPASGDRVWSVPLDVHPQCGPAGYPGLEPVTTPVLVCLHGVGAAREAFTVHPDGAVSTARTLDTSDDRYGAARPGPDGTVLRARRVGSLDTIDTADARCTEETGECSGTVEAGRDLLLRAEDAVTGAERWAVTVPFRATGALECTPWYGNPWDGWDDVPDDEPLAPDAFGAQVGAGFVDVWGCGVGAAVSADGALLRTDDVLGQSGTIPLSDGRHVIEVSSDMGPDSSVSTRTTLFGPDGDVVAEFPGYVSGPWTVDDPDGMVLLGSSESGYRMHSYALDGTERWAVEVGGSAPEPLAQVAGTVVAASWIGGVRGYDLRTGEERWRWQPGDAASTASFGGVHAAQAFTDGRFVLLSLRSDDGALRLASLDATSGELAWDSSTADGVDLAPDASLLSVDGRLLVVTPSGVTGLG